MSLFIYPVSHADQLLVAIREARECPNVKPMSVNAADFRRSVRALSYHNLLLIPGLEHTTPEIDRLKAIALYMGIEVRPLIAHVEKVLHMKDVRADQQRNKRTAGVGAASPTQRIAPVVQPTV